MLRRLFGGDSEATSLIHEYDQCNTFANQHEGPEGDQASSRATDLYLENDLYDYCLYAEEAIGTDQVRLPEESW